MDAAGELDLSVHQVRRLVHRLEAAGGNARAPWYPRHHPAPNPVGAEVAAAARVVQSGRSRVGAVSRQLEGPLVGVTDDELAA